MASRGLLAGLFFTVNSYLPLTLNGTHGWSLAAAGIPLIVGSLGWSASAAWQGRHPELCRTRLLRVGFCALAVGTAGMLLVTPSWGSPWLAAPFWLLAGIGMGLGFPSVSYLLLQQSAVHRRHDRSRGRTARAARLPAVALPVLVAVLTGLAAAGAALAGRTAVDRGTN